MKLKQGRFWFIRCKYPIPLGPDPFAKSFPRVPAKATAGAVLLRPMRQPLHDTVQLTPRKAGDTTLFHTSGVPGKWGYYWMSEDKEVVWSYSTNKATRFDTREDAETRAFELATLAPWLISKLEIVKMKLERES